MSNMVTTTTAALHFEDLDPIRFEDLIEAVVYRLRRWEKLYHYGKKGSDDGIDIKSVELLENGKRITHYFQCKRYSKISATELRKIIDDYLAKNKEIPDFYYVVIGCPVSKRQFVAFEEYCKNNGFKSYCIWDATYIEAMLYGDYHDLLFAYFGVNLTEKRSQRIGSIRRNIALKKRMRNDFIEYPSTHTSAERWQLMEEPWRKFKSSEVIIRSIYDKGYPENNTLMDKSSTGYFKAEVYDFYHNGLLVRAHPYVKDILVTDDAALDLSSDHKKTRVARVEVLGCIPFENIIDYDMDGDEYYSYPHLFCDFTNPTDPYEGFRYIEKDSHYIFRDDEVINENL